MTPDRRTVLKGLVAGALAKGLRANAEEPAGVAEGWGPGVRIWDAHGHPSGDSGDTIEERMTALVRAMDRLGIERIILSHGFNRPIGDYQPHGAHTPHHMREENDQVMQAVRYFPDRLYGSVYLNPANGAFCIDELNRCLRDGPMICIGELETDVRAASPLLDPIVEWAVRMNVPILQHTWLNATGNLPGESTPWDVVQLARRHPQAQIICGHTGGNWELGIRTIRDTKNIYAGIAGSDPTSGFTEMAVRELGAERVIYGSDAGGRSLASQLAKVVGAEIPEPAKAMILGGNLRRLLQPILRAKGLAS